MGVFSCKGCIPPKRHPGCHASCPEYIAEKAAHEERKAMHDKERDISCAITNNRTEKVIKALKRHGKK